MGRGKPFKINTELKIIKRKNYGYIIIIIVIFRTRCSSTRILLIARCDAGVSARVPANAVREMSRVQHTHNIVISRPGGAHRRQLWTIPFPKHI